MFPLPNAVVSFPSVSNVSREPSPELYRATVNFQFEPETGVYPEQRRCFR